MIEKSLKHFLQHYDSELNIIIAYSGGVDSQVLLHALTQLKHANKLQNSLTVCHVNHGLSVNATKWQEFAKQACEAYSIDFHTVNVDIKPTPQTSLEAQARDARYNALKGVKKESSLILTGHHSDDQTETFLLALKRGSGLKGLSAMAVESVLGQHKLLRPLLNIPRHEIERYANKHQLTWVEDESNSDTRFDRNFIRHDIVPLLSKRWPGISETINRSARHCLEGQSLLNEMAEQDLALCRVSQEKALSNEEQSKQYCSSQAPLKQLLVDKLLTLSSARFNNLIRYFLASHNCLMPSSEQLEQVYKQLHAPQDKNPSIKVGDYYFRRYKNTLYLTPVYQDLTGWNETIVMEKEPQRITLPDKLGFLDLVTSKANPKMVTLNMVEKHTGKCISTQNIIVAKEGQQVTLSFAHANPTCSPDYRDKSRPVKKVLQELSIPPWQRKRIPFMYYENELVAAIGHFVCKPFGV